MKIVETTIQAIIITFEVVWKETDMMEETGREGKRREIGKSFPDESVGWGFWDIKMGS